MDIELLKVIIPKIRIITDPEIDKYKAFLLKYNPHTIKIKLIKRIIHKVPIVTIFFIIKKILGFRPTRD